MALLSFDNLGITAICGAVPKRIVKNLEYTEFFPVEQVSEIVEKIGIYERRFADEKTCASDLCFAAAEKMFNEYDVKRDEIDLLIFVSQTPDYRMPSTSVILQHRLGLPNSTIAFDVNTGCSGFIYGLSIIYGFMQNSGVRKALLLDGETRSKAYSAKDRRCAFLFGDAGVAVLIEKDEKFKKSFFTLNSDGSRSDLIKIEGGGYRIPSSEDTLKERVVDEFGNIRSLEQGYMNGADVFNFLIREVPKDFKAILEFSKIQKEEIDYFVFHQANQYMNSYLVKKLKIDPDKTPSTLSKFGNTSSVSIPITIVSELKNKLDERKKVLLSGFGAGLLWASCIIEFENCYIGDIVEI